MSKKYLNLLLIIVSGILSGFSIYHLNFWLIWFALIPFFLVLPAKSIKQSILYGLVFGLTQGGILLYWIIEATARFSGTETLIGVPIFILATIFYSIYPILFSTIYSYLLKDKSFKSRSIIITILITAFVWIILEWSKVNLLMGVSWVKDTLAVSQLKNLYGIQWASITGQWGISFIIIIVNLLFAFAIKDKKAKYIIPASALILLFYVSGLLIYNLNIKDDGVKIKVAIIQENIRAETRWDESNGNEFARRFFDLNQEAASHNPDLIVWSETALPWIYSPNDDLIAAALKITQESQASHIIGILSEADTDATKVYNSAYYINPEGDVISRYDKVNLLSFIETSIIKQDLKIPFLSEGMYSNILAGHSYDPLKTSFGNLGVLICNESLTPYEAKKLVDHGANLLINMSNDGWVENTHLIDQHFYVARLRAVETGMDMVINSNRGYGGHIAGNGTIIAQKISQKETCIISTVSISQYTTIYYKYGDWIIYLSIIIIILFSILKTVKKNAL